MEDKPITPPETVNTNTEPPTPPPEQTPPAPAATPPADPPAQPSILKDTNEVVARLEAANKETKALLDRKELMEVESRIGGETHAGTQEKTKEQKETESAKAYLAGTGLEKMAFPDDAPHEKV